MKKSIVRVLALVLMLTLVITSSAAALKLQKNDKSDNVRRLQQALTQLGYYSGTVDGSFGSGTKAAVSAFQQANSLTVDGIAGSATIALLEKQTGIDIDGNSSSSSSTAAGLFKGDYSKLQYTSSGSRVRVLQQALKDLGFTISKVDGVFGQSTFEAVMAFQKATGLTVDGKAGKNTLVKLESYFDSNGNVTQPMITPKPTADLDNIAYGIPTRTLREGMGGQDVLYTQDRLAALGYLTGISDGQYGAATKAAVLAFQKKNGLSADGVLGTNTRKRLFSEGAIGAKETSQPDGVGERKLTLGMKGDDVKSVQQRLKDLGYLTDKVDGKYGANTVAAMRAFQLRNGLTGSGNGDTATYTILYSVNAITAEGKQVDSTTPTVYTNLKVGATGDAVLRLQQALSNLRYTVTINGTYDETTRAAVLAFQKRNGLAPDGIAGVNTQTKLYTGDCVTGDTALPDENKNGGTGNSGASFGNGPAKSQIKLQMWYTEIKPTIKSGQTVLVYEPSSGSSFRLRFYSLGRHADSEPLTAQDTAIMKAAWGGKFSWDEKPVYVLLPSGTWVLASMHCMPHLSGSIKDNDFDGHLCVHFPRTMEETAKLDPKNGVRHQKDIRKAWKALTGEDITW